MQTPWVQSWNKLKRVGRFLKGCPRLVQQFVWQVEQEELVEYADSDFAKDKTRKSTTSTAMMHGAHMIKYYCGLQAVPAISVGEAEFYAAVKGMSDVLGGVSFALDLGKTLRAVLMVDSTACIGMAARRGLGRARHIETKYMWIQYILAQKRAWMRKVATEKNLADMGTKNVDQKTMWFILTAMGFVAREGRSKLAPGLTA